ncbi:type VI secretion system amidase immunity protein Tai4 [Conchiformibius steedae DSM 2580]|uniref:Type VI secretion system amidase immunity protein Tai4 n=1 Tax=Conchiformibius steedae DSM 2580 TaxID=1121352 RepID=A0AAE9HSM3_9NEIS|nr:T6SS amidase immunity protein Tai4 family protein [Conchiformibius steedae]QMT34140.1 hypothetical protein H3L98_03830 [Conchiformibius steedae]URD66913.1 type VI secretion system amidase immunity protein Tai4 [Conchiformibius steedae DSM 2580]
MKKIILCFLIILIFPVYADNELNRSRYFLKNYGISYCLATFSLNAEIKNDAGHAESFYFQSGKHHGDAYQAVSDFMKKEFPKMTVTDSANNPLIFYKCLELYHSKKYNRFILQLDKYYLK